MVFSAASPHLATKSSYFNDNTTTAIDIDVQTLYNRSMVNPLILGVFRYHHGKSQSPEHRALPSERNLCACPSCILENYQ